MLNSIERFQRDRRGAMATVFVLILTTLLAAAGVTLDYSRALNQRSEAQNVADTMVLAAARAFSLNGEKDAGEAAAAQLFFGHYPETTDKMFQFSVKRNGSVYDTNIEIDGSTQATFLTVIGWHQIPWKVESSAAASQNKAEIVLVADISRSMKGSKFSDMKAALRELVDTIFANGMRNDDRRVSLIPFAESVNFGVAYEDWLDPDRADAPKPDFVGCFRPEPDEALTRLITDGIGPGHYQAFTQSYFGRDSSYTYCPSERSKALLFESDPRALKARIAGLELGYGTGTDIALAWGWRAISPEWRGRFAGDRDYPLDHDEGVKKVLILLTDGVAVRKDPEGDGARIGITRNDVQTELAGDNYSAICDAIRKRNDIELFMIAYSLEQKHKSFRDAMMPCVSGEGKFYDADIGQLGTVLDEIAANSLYSVYLSR